MHHPAGPAVCPYLKNAYFIPSKDKSKSTRSSSLPWMCSAALQRKMHLWSIDALFAILLGRITGVRWCQHKAQCWRTLRRWKPAPGAGTVGGSCQCCSLACLSWAKLYKLFLKTTHSNASDSFTIQLSRFALKHEKVESKNHVYSYNLDLFINAAHKQLRMRCVDL